MADPTDTDDPDKGIPTKSETRAWPADGGDFSERSEDNEEPETRDRDEDQS